MGIPPACYQQCPVTPLLLPYDILVRRQSKYEHKFGLTNGLPQGICRLPCFRRGVPGRNLLVGLGKTAKLPFDDFSLFSVASFSPACLNRSLRRMVSDLLVLRRLSH